VPRVRKNIPTVGRAEPTARPLATTTLLGAARPSKESISRFFFFFFFFFFFLFCFFCHQFPACREALGLPLSVFCLSLFLFFLNPIPAWFIVPLPRARSVLFNRDGFAPHFGPPRRKPRACFQYPLQCAGGSWFYYSILANFLCFAGPLPRGNPPNGPTASLFLSFIFREQKSAVRGGSQKRVGFLPNPRPSCPSLQQNEIAFAFPEKSRQTRHGRMIIGTNRRMVLFEMRACSSVREIPFAKVFAEHPVPRNKRRTGLHVFGSASAHHLFLFPFLLSTLRQSPENSACPRLTFATQAPRRPPHPTPQPPPNPHNRPHPPPTPPLNPRPPLPAPRPPPPTPPTLSPPPPPRPPPSPPPTPSPPPPPPPPIVSSPCPSF